MSHTKEPTILQRLKVAEEHFAYAAGDRYHAELCYYAQKEIEQLQQQNKELVEALKRSAFQVSRGNYQYAINLIEQALAKLEGKQT